MSVDRASALPSRPSPGAAGARLGELYAAHSRMVYGICRMLLRDANEAEDATQEVFLSAYANLLTGTEVHDPAAWLGTIARNACRRRAAARMREPLAYDDEPTLVSPPADETAIGREEAAAVYAQLAVLPEKQRAAVVLRDLYGLRYDEVAKALGTSRPAVEALLFRGRRQLQRRLRPGVAAGVLVVPLAIQESIAYAVPGFASTAAPVGAAAAAAGIPLVAKLATAGAAVALVGSAGVVAERGFHDPPSRPADTKVQRQEPSADLAAKPSSSVLLPIPPGGFPVVRRRDENDNSGPGNGAEEPERNENRGEGNADDDRVEAERVDNSGPGGGGERGDAADAEPELADDDHSGPGHGAEPAVTTGTDVDSSGSGSDSSGSSGSDSSGSSGSGSDSSGSGSSGGGG